MRLNINTQGVQFICTRPAEARIDRDTGAPRMDRETGLPLWQCQLAALDETGGEVLAVTVAGQIDVTVGQPVTVEGLYALPWTQGDRSGVAYRATSIRPVGAPITAPAPAPTNTGNASTGSGKQAA